MSTIDIDKYLKKDLDGVLFEGGKHLGTLRDRNGYTPDIKSLTEKEWYYLIETAHDAYIAGARRVATELNRQADAEVRRAQREAEKRIERIK